MEKVVDELIANLQAVQAAGDVAIEYESFISGAIHPPHNEVINSSLLMMAVLDARYTLYRIAQFINASHLGQIIETNDAEKHHMVYLNHILPQLLEKRQQVIESLTDVVNNKVYTDGSHKPESVEPLVSEQLKELGRHARIAVTTAERIRAIRKG